MSYTYPYPRPAVTTDVALFSRQESAWHVLLIQRKNAPFQDHWALPGGFLDENEAPETGAARELEEETNLSAIALSPLGFWGEPGRDPRGHTVSLVFWATTDTDQSPVAKDDAKKVAWFPLTGLPELAFDHDLIINAAIDEVQQDN